MKLKVGPRLHTIRDNRKLNQVEMAELLGMSTSAYARMERGETSPELEQLPQFAEALDAPIQELLPETLTINNSHNQHQGGVIVGNVYNNYYDRNEYSKSLEVELEKLRAENESLRSRLEN
jgi:transcriptional regulator with XRE-family HTH domain